MSRKTTAKTMQLKQQINRYAKENRIAAQVVLQNYMFERFLDRLAGSPYQEKFIIKGGMLVAALVGLDTRSTMDLDATLRHLQMTETQVRKAAEEICGLDLADGVAFTVVSVSEIRKKDRYSGYAVRMDARYESMVIPLSMDISTGDAMTPAPVPYEFSGIFDEELRIRLWGYNVETVLAEKAETILSRGIFNTRPRDFYDIYVLCTTQNYDPALFSRALAATAAHRGTADHLTNAPEHLPVIESSQDLRDLWGKYQKKFSYAKEISFDAVTAALRDLLRDFQGGNPQTTASNPSEQPEANKEVASPEAAGAAQAAPSPKAAEASRNADSPEESNTPEATGKSEPSDAAILPKEPDLSEASAPPEPLRCPNGSEKPKLPQAAEASEGPKAPQAAQPQYHQRKS